MLIIWIPVGILLLYVALHSFYLAVWDKKLSASIYFTKRTVTEGDELTLVEEVANAKRIPLPVLIMEYKLNRNIRMHGNENASVTDRTNVIEYFSLGPREKVLREHRLTAEKRGYYRIDSSDIEVPELFSGKRGYMHLVQDTDLIMTATAGKLTVRQGGKTWTFDVPYDGKPAQLYRVRKSWSNTSSQIGAYSILANARDAADKAGSAYAVFDWNGKEIYRKVGPRVPYLVRVKKEMEIRKGPGAGYGKAERKCPAGLFTIVEVKNGWGRLKSGAGWIQLSKTEKI